MEPWKLKIYILVLNFHFTQNFGYVVMYVEVIYWFRIFFQIILLIGMLWKLMLFPTPEVDSQTEAKNVTTVTPGDILLSFALILKDRQYAYFVGWKVMRNKCAQHQCVWMWENS